MQDVVNNVAQNKIYSTLDMSSAYHQVDIPLAIECTLVSKLMVPSGSGKNSIGLSSAVPAFQRIMDDILTKNDCKGTFAYVDNITVGGKTQQELDLTFNDSKCIYSTDCIKLLDYQITKRCLKPHEDRVKTLLMLPPPTSMKEQQRIVGLFAYYAQWIIQYSNKIKPLLQNCTFPLSNDALKSFEPLKSEAEVFLRCR